MWILSLLLGSVCISVLTANPTSELQACVERVDVDKLNELVKHPSEDELDIVCPMILGLFDCVENVVVTHLGVKIKDLVEMMPGTDVAKGATLLVNVKSVFSDLCTEGTNLSEAYKEHASCFHSIPHDEEDQDRCILSAFAAYDTYREFENSVQEQASSNSPSVSHKQCMVEAYKSACIAAKIFDHCGQGAFDFYQQVVKQTSIFRTAICSEEDLMELKTKFADSLDLESEKKDLFRLAFDLKKRRK